MEKELCEELAELFSAISAGLIPIESGTTIPTPEEDRSIRISKEEITERLKKCKKPRGLLYGDIFPHLVTKHASILSIPLQAIFNAALTNEVWPDPWKIEHVTPIPKCNQPTSFNELRNISCTTLFSKVLEFFVLEKAKTEIGANINQFGGIAGTSTNHYLISAWNMLLESLDNAERTAVSMISVDFAKAFNTMSHTACVNAFRHKGSSNHVTNMVSSFLSNRFMKIRVGDTYSDLRPINGRRKPSGDTVGQFPVHSYDRLPREKGRRTQ